MSDAKKKRPERKEGELRMSSAMLGAGPGAMLDLTETSVMIASTDQWGNPLLFRQYGPQFQEVKDHRLQEYVRRSLDATDPVRLFHPAPAEDEDGVPSENGVRAWEFPEWFVTREYVDPKRSNRTQRSRVLVHKRSLKGGELEIEADDDDLLVDRGPAKSRGRSPRSQKVPVVPVRFVRACPQGHIEDINWRSYAHPNGNACDVRGSLRLEERGTSGDLAELFVVCAVCKTEQSLVRATEKEKASGLSSLGRCGGREIWKGLHVKVECMTNGKPTPAKLLVRSASNAWFPAPLSAITLPATDATKSEIRKLVDTLWDDVFSGVTEALDLRGYRKNIKYKEALAAFSDDAFVAECAAKRAETEAFSLTPAPAEGDRPTGPKVAELETFLAVKGHAGVDEIGSMFFAESTPAPARKGHGTRPFVDRVVLVHRLREVRALVGFTRFEAPVTTIDGELDLNVTPAALGTHKQWVPAVENHGEGVFFSLDPERVNDWRWKQPGVRARRDQLNKGFERWRDDRGSPKARFLDVPYILLHSLSHMLITAVSLECGYPSSSIRERIYAIGDRYGILLYTASADAEGTLGGLVATGRQLERHLQSALEIGRLCSNDPVCAGHDPDNATGELTLQGAACHGCLLISETSCERQNTWLDRALVVPTVSLGDAAFFRGW